MNKQFAWADANAALRYNADSIFFGRQNLPEQEPSPTFAETMETGDKLADRRHSATI